MSTGSADPTARESGESREPEAIFSATVSGRIQATVRVEFQTPAYVISVAAELSGMHPQTLRQYDRLGLVTPGRTLGGGRRYSAQDVSQLREIQRLSQEEGMNLAGVRRVLDLENQVTALRARIAELQAEVARSRAAVAAAEAEFASGLYRRTYLPAVLPPDPRLPGCHAPAPSGRRAGDASPPRLSAPSSGTGRAGCRPRVAALAARSFGDPTAPVATEHDLLDGSAGAVAGRSMSRRSPAPATPAATPST